MIPDAQLCDMPGCEHPAVDPSGGAGLCREHRPDLDGRHDQDEHGDTDESVETPAPEGGSPRSNPIPDADERGSSDPVLDSGAGYAEIFRHAQTLDERDPWEYVTERALRTALGKAGHADLLDHGVLAQIDDWQAVDFAAEDADEPDWRYFYLPAAPDPRPDEFRQFHEALVDAAPDGYDPYYFRVETAGKAPATEYGSWKDDVNRLTVDEAIEWMERGGNVGIAGTLDDPLVNIDVDDGEATTPEDLPETLRARSRSRAGWHGWAFDPDDEIPNLPTDALGEVRTDWQYVVAPGSFVASTREEIPDERLNDDPGYYTLEHEAPVATIGYDDLPESFRDWHEQHEQQTPPTDAETDGDLLDDDTDDDRDQDRPTGGSAVFDVDARGVVRQEGGSTDVSDRWAALFHGSSTNANMSLSGEGRLQCWRHNVAHGGLQALAALSDQSPTHACRKIGTGHSRSGAGGCQYSGDWRLIWWAWEYAKGSGYIPDDDPIPYRVLVNLAVRDGLVDREALVKRPTDDGDESYLGFPDAVTYNAALEHVRDEYDRDPGRDAVDGSARGDGDPDHTAVLPPAVRDLSTATSGWDWKHAARDGGTLTVDDARERTVEAIADAYTSGDRVLIEALPTMGKSYGAVKAAAETDEQITILTGRGRKEQYSQIQEWCDEHGLDVYTLPSFGRDCPTAAGEHGEDWKQTVMDWYHRGATPQKIHKSAEYHLGEPLPCQRHEGHSCPYASLWNFDPDEFDVLLGHYTHGYKQKVTTGRTVVFDEFPDAYERELGATKRAVSYWLSTVDAVPFKDYTDLVEHRDDQARRGEALLWFDEHGVEPDESHVFEAPHARADAPLAVYALLAGEDLGNGFERVRVDDDTGTVAVYDRESTAVHALRPPDLTYASGVVALDGTPTKRLWELSLGTRLNHRPVLADDEERAEYIEHALNLNLVRTTEYIKSYNSPDHVNTDQDAALLEAIADEHDTRPGLITTATAESEYNDVDVLKLVDETKHYGNVLGSNEFAETRLGAVIGSNHYGDQYVQKWGAYAGEAVERDDGTKGQDLSYGGGVADDVLQHMREHDTLQAAMRFGRDGNGAVVYVHTDTLPDWVPLAGEVRVLKTWSDGMQSVVDALADLGAGTTAEIAALPTVDIGERQVLDHLNSLCDRGVLARHRDPDDGRAVRWTDVGLDELNGHGAVELDTDTRGRLPSLEELEVHELERMSRYYTWEFVNSARETVDARDQRGESTTRVADRATNGGDPPPEGAD